MKHLSILAAASLFGLGACASSKATSAPPPEALPPVMGVMTPRAPEPAVLTPTAAPKQPTAIVGATLLLGNGHHIENGTIIFSDGLIRAVGPAAEIEVPSGARVLDASGRFVTPGLIDTHSHMGVYPAPYVEALEDGNEMTDPTTPYVFSEHSFWPQDPALQRAVAGGVTTVQVLPGSGNIIGGRAVTLKLAPYRETRAMRFPDAPFGLKMACGENPKRVYGSKGRAPMSRMGSIAQLREKFIEARAYRYRWRQFEEERRRWQEAYDRRKADPSAAAPKDEPSGPDRNLGLETLADVLDGKILVHIHCYRADEMLQMIALGKELGFTVRSFHHAVEAYKIGDVLAKEQVAASMWSDWWGFKIEAYDGIEENIPMVAKAGGRSIVHSDSPIGVQRLNQDAAKALYAGRRAGLELDEDEAIRWVTENPAWALGILEKTGTLEVGKMADVVVWTDRPLSIYAKAQRVYVDGRLVYDLEATPKTWSDFELGTEAEGVRP